jgi:hypothetical protein
MKMNRGRISGFLGAIIIHLIAGITFMLIKLGSLDIKEYTKEYQISLEDLSQTERRPIIKDQSGTSVEKIFQDDREVLNIARNLANQPDVKINAEDYIDKVKEELIQSGKLGKDNYIDEQKKARDNNQNGIMIPEKQAESKKADDKVNDANKMAASYSGPTRIYYSLKGRNHTYLPIPIYKCEGSGKAVLAIEVSQKGNVLNAKIIPAESTTNDPCLIEAALNSALVSRFSPDVNAPKIQTGTLTYHFVAQ